MSPEILKEQVRKQPFQPFRIFLTDGSFYDIRHPENCMITKRDVFIGLGGEDEEMPSRGAICDPLHIVKTEPLNGARTSGHPRPN